jgi:formate/nitrite transporter
MDNPPMSPDALPPEQVALQVEAAGIARAGRDATMLFTLAVLAGAFIALGAMVSTLASVGIGDLLPYGLGRLVMGTVFALGLILVVVCGAELFTGDVLMTVAWASRRLTSARLLQAWAIVLAGNLVGGAGTALLVFLSGHPFMADGTIAAAALDVAAAKSALPPGRAFFLGVLCNVLVCLAVWASLAARSVADKVLVVIPPVAAFVAAGFEHSVANFYYLGLGWLVRNFAPGSFWAQAGTTPEAFAGLTLDAFVRTQSVVVLGNVAGGACLVALVYWLAYRRPPRAGT